MSDDTEISLDEYLSTRKAIANDDGIVFKAATSTRSWDDGRRAARFVMSTQDVDRDGDIIVTAGIDLVEFQKNPIMLINHNPSLRGGQWENVEIKSRRMEGDAVFKAAGRNALVDEAALDVKDGLMRGASIGFRPKTVKRREMEDGKPVYGYVIEASTLWECSVVTIPANAMALVKGKDGAPLRLATEFIEQVLDVYVKDPATGLIVPRSEYETAHKEATGNKTVVVTAPVVDEAVEGEGDAFAALAEAGIKAATAIERLEDTLFTRIGRKLGLIKPEPEPPALATAEEKAAALRLADEIEARARAKVAA